MVSGMVNKPAPTIRDLYPDLSEAELAQVEDSLEQYLALVLEIFEHLESEADAEAGHLTPDSGEIPCNS
jgi:hypothetical protein